MKNEKRKQDSQQAFITKETYGSKPKNVQSVILAMLPDTSERYMSTPLYESIAADMDEEELEIAKSTPSFQLIPGQEPTLQM